MTNAHVTSAAPYHGIHTKCYFEMTTYQDWLIIVVSLFAMNSSHKKFKEDLGNITSWKTDCELNEYQWFLFFLEIDLSSHNLQILNDNE